MRKMEALTNTYHKTRFGKTMRKIENILYIKLKKNKVFYMHGNLADKLFGTVFGKLLLNLGDFRAHLSVTSPVWPFAGGPGPVAVLGLSMRVVMVIIALLVH